MPMKQSNTFELNEEMNDYSIETIKDCCPGKFTIKCIMSYAKALEVFKTGNGIVFYNINN